MPRRFVSHPCTRCDTKQSIKGMRGFCSKECRDPPRWTSTKRNKRNSQGASSTDPVDDRPAGRPSTKGVELGNMLLALFWFSITITLSNGDVPVLGADDKFALAGQWLDLVCTRGCFGIERGKKQHQLHLQGCAEIRAPPPEEKGHLMVSRSLRKLLRLTIGSGYKITVKYFAKNQHPSAMVGYCMKDMRQGWFRFVCKGLSKKDLATARQNYMSLKQSYCSGKSLIEKRAFMFEVYKFYAMYLMPLQLTVCQIVRFMLLSGLFTFGNTWVYSAGDRPLDVIKVQCLWTLVNDSEHATIEQISTILFGDSASHSSGQVTNLSSVWGAKNDDFANNADFVPVSSADPNDTRGFEEARDIARQARCSPAELDLAAEHIFGENENVPDSAIVTHTDGKIIDGVFDRVSVAIPDGLDPADATNRARPFSSAIDRDGDKDDTDKYTEDTDNEEPAFSDIDESETNHGGKHTAQKRKRQTTALNCDSDSDSDSELGF